MEKRRNAKGEGSFKENLDGTVTHRKCVGYLPNGNRKVLTVTASSRAMCIKEMKKKEVEWSRVRGLHHRAGIHGNRAMRGASALSGG